MKILVTGSRDWPHDKMGIILDAIKASGATILVHGAARGVDSMAAHAGRLLNLDVRPYPAEWTVDGVYNPGAGPQRNQRMLDEEHRPDEPIERVLAFPRGESRGTYDMIRRCEAAGLRVTTHWLTPNGALVT